MTNNSVAHDPGTATVPVKIAAGQYDVDSFRGEAKAYRVDVIAGTCTCPHFIGRLAGTGQDCKHLKTCRGQHAVDMPTETALEAASRKAKTLREDDLLRLAQRYQGQAAGAACWLELARRQAAADRDAQYRAIFS